MMPGRPLRIAMVGTRGVPATFGGVEHHVEQIGARLAERGHDVTVYCRSNYVDGPTRTYKGMTIRLLPTVAKKSLDTIVHSALSTATALGRRYDVVHYHAIGPGLVAPAARYLSSASVVQTIHGLDNERAKWNGFARTVLGVGGWMSARVPDATIVVSKALVEHYAERYGRAVTYIPNGAAVEELVPPDEIGRAWGLRAGSYVLYLGRFVPEKCPHVLLRAFRQVDTDLRLVMAGGSSFTDSYVTELEDLAKEDPRVLLPGYVYGRQRQELYANAALFVLPSALEGLPLTLLEAIGFGVPVVATAIPPHLEVLGETDQPGGRLVAPEDDKALAGALQGALDDLRGERDGLQGFRDRVLKTYDWDSVTDDTEQVYLDVVRRARAGRRRG